MKTIDDLDNIDITNFLIICEENYDRINKLLFTEEDRQEAIRKFIIKETEEKTIYAIVCENENIRALIKDILKNELSEGNYLLIDKKNKAISEQNRLHITNQKIEECIELGFQFSGKANLNSFTIQLKRLKRIIDKINETPAANTYLLEILKDTAITINGYLIRNYNKMQDFSEAQKEKIQEELDVLIHSFDFTPSLKIKLEMFRDDLFKKTKNPILFYQDYYKLYNEFLTLKIDILSHNISPKMSNEKEINFREEIRRDVENDDLQNLAYQYINTIVYELKSQTDTLIKNIPSLSKSKKKKKKLDNDLKTKLTRIIADFKRVEAWYEEYRGSIPAPITNYLRYLESLIN